MKTIASAYNRLIMGLAVLSGAAVVLAFVMIVVDVTIRTAGLRPPGYTIAVVEYSLLYITMFAAPYLVRRKGHVYIDALSSRLPPRVQWAVNKLAYAISIVASLVFAWYAVQLLREAIVTGRLEERGVDMPLWILYLPIPIGFALVAVELARYLVGIDSMYSDRLQTRDSM